MPASAVSAPSSLAAYLAAEAGITLAKYAASEDGADTAASSGIPASAAFCTSSDDTARACVQPR